MRSSFSVAFATLAGIASYFILWAPISNAVDIRTIISFVLGAIATSSAEDRPNNKRADLIEKYGEDGYNALIAEACGLANIPYAVSDSDVVRHQSSSAQYGTDVSFPIHNTKLQVSTNYPWLPHNIKLAEDPSVAFIPHMYTSMPVQPLGNRAKFYEEYMSACRDKYRDKGYLCDLNEEIRVEMNMRQPRSMQVSGKAVGFQPFLKRFVSRSNSGSSSGASVFSIMPLKLPILLPFS